MKTLNEKKICARLFAALTVPVLFATSAFADGLAGVVQPVVSLLESLLTPALAVVGAVGALYCVLLGVKFAKAEEPQDREKAKTHLKNAIIGFVLIFVLLLGLKLLTPVMEDWVDTQSKAAGQGSVFGN